MKRTNSSLKSQTKIKEQTNEKFQDFTDKISKDKLGQFLVKMKHKAQKANTKNKDNLFTLLLLMFEILVIINLVIPLNYPIF